MTGVSVIVVAEDDADVHVLLELLLQSEGHEVHMARNGAAALALLDEVAADLAVLDIAMPGDLDGIDVTRAMRADADNARVPVLLLSARSSEDDLSRGVEAGADKYLVKPFDTDAMLDAVRTLLAEGHAP